ncbi:MAG: hypothetical protein SPJ70_06840 [Candidatus Borkfalkiaceae bacterium]|nr:hypothetical protein [Christensenellaceae bacterium]
MRTNLYRRLLKEYCDALISLQDKSGDEAFNGGVYCRACKNIHGRCPDAVYGLVVAAKIFEDDKYLQAANDVFAYGENLLCDDGGMYNDAQTTWRYTTTFHQIAVIEALRSGAGILGKETIKSFENRAEKMAKWLYENLDEMSPANINYATTNGLALALSGNYFHEQKYLDEAKRLISYAIDHITENGLLYGESRPHDKISAKGCKSVDIGYNVEESVPALVKYAFEVDDEELKNRLVKTVRAHLDFMLPDGGWDNSFGNRNNKWTYWGSRTSDGCAPMFLLLADRDTAFAEAAYRNVEMLDKCSMGGLLYGGPHYYKRGEYACTHHTFEHVNSLAFVLEHVDEKYLTPLPSAIPSDGKDLCKYYPEVRTYKLAKGDYLATVTDYDFDIYFSGHATGGMLTALYNRKCGPMIMGSVTDYVLVEPTNMQQVKDRQNHKSLLPRLVRTTNGEEYSSTFYLDAAISEEKVNDGYLIRANTGLSDKNGKELVGINPQIEYALTENGLDVKVIRADGLKFVLPLIAGEVKVQSGKIEGSKEVFFLTGGFIAQEYTILPDESGNIRVSVEA